VESLSVLIPAITFGLLAGLKPGPLGVFVIHQTMHRGLFSGFVASLGPIIADGPIIVLTLLLSDQLERIEWFAPLISLAGALYLLKLAYKIYSIKSSVDPSIGKNGSGTALKSAVMISLLNPSVYLFWMTIGSSYIINTSASMAMTFIVGAILSLCFTKFAVAFAIRELGQKFSPRFYAQLLRFLAVPLILFSFQLAYKAYQGFF